MPLVVHAPRDASCTWATIMATGTPPMSSVIPCMATTRLSASSLRQPTHQLMHQLMHQQLHQQVQQPSTTWELLDARHQTSVGSVKAIVIVTLTAQLASSAFSARHLARQYLVVKAAAT